MLRAVGSRLPSLLRASCSRSVAYESAIWRLPVAASARAAGVKKTGALMSAYARRSHELPAAATPPADRLLLPGVDARLLSDVAASDGSPSDSMKVLPEHSLFPTGDGFLERSGLFWADKTNMVSTFIESQSGKAVILRPRRQGKTHMLELVELLLSAEREEEEIEAALQGTWIMATEQEGIRDKLEVGQHNVLKLDLAGWRNDEVVDAASVGRRFAYITTEAFKKFWKKRFPLTAYPREYEQLSAADTLVAIAKRCTEEAQQTLKGIKSFPYDVPTGNGGRLVLLVDEMDMLYTSLMSEKRADSKIRLQSDAASSTIDSFIGDKTTLTGGESDHLVERLKSAIPKKYVTDALVTSLRIAVEAAKLPSESSPHPELASRVQDRVRDVVDDLRLPVEQKNMAEKVRSLLMDLYGAVKIDRDQFGHVISTGISPVLLDRLGSAANLNIDRSSDISCEALIGLEEEEVVEGLLVAQTACSERVLGATDHQLSPAIRQTALSAGREARPLLQSFSRWAAARDVSRADWLPEALLCQGLLTAGRLAARYTSSGEAVDGMAAAVAVAERITVGDDKDKQRMKAREYLLNTEGMDAAEVEQMETNDLILTWYDHAHAGCLLAAKALIPDDALALADGCAETAWAAGLAEMKALLSEDTTSADGAASELGDAPSDAVVVHGGSAAGLRQWWRQQRLFGGVAGDLAFLRDTYNGYRFAREVRNKWEEERRLYGSQLVMMHLQELVNSCPKGSVGEPPSRCKLVESKNVELSDATAKLLLNLEGTKSTVLELLMTGKLPMWDADYKMGDERPSVPSFLDSESHKEARKLLYYFGGVTSGYEKNERTHLRVTNVFARQNLLTELYSVAAGGTSQVRALSRTVEAGLLAGSDDGWAAMCKGLHALSTSPLARQLLENGENKQEAAHAEAFRVMWQLLWIPDGVASLTSEVRARKLSTGNTGHLDSLLEVQRVAEGKKKKKKKPALVMLERKAITVPAGNLFEGVRMWDGPAVRARLASVGKTSWLKQLDEAVAQVSSYDVKGKLQFGEEEEYEKMRCVAMCFPDEQALLYRVTDEECDRVRKEVEEKREREKREVEEKKEREKREWEEKRERRKREEEEKREREQREWERKRVLSNPDTPIEEWLEAVADGFGEAYGEILSASTAGRMTAGHLPLLKPHLEELGVKSLPDRLFIEDALKMLKE